MSDETTEEVTETTEEVKDVYFVSLPMQVDGSSPQDAVESFMKQIVDFGLRAWTYNVQKQNDPQEEHDLERVLIVTGKGHILSEPVEEEEDGEAGDVPTPDDAE